MVAVIVGRPEIVEDVRPAPSDVRLHLASRILEWLSAERFADALPGILLTDALSMLVPRTTGAEATAIIATAVNKETSAP